MAFIHSPFFWHDSFWDALDPMRTIREGNIIYTCDIRIGSVMKWNRKDHRFPVTFTAESIEFRSDLNNASPFDNSKINTAIRVLIAMCLHEVRRFSIGKIYSVDEPWVWRVLSIERDHALPVIYFCHAPYGLQTTLLRHSCHRPFNFALNSVANDGLQGVFFGYHL
jgi:hypothetical protein